MKITVLVENSEGSAGTQAEHGLSFFIETSNHNIIADTGASALAWTNAEKLGVDVGKADISVISHGHYDHTGGLLSFYEKNSEADIYIQTSAFGEFYHGERYIGVDKRVENLPSVRKIDGDYRIDDELYIFSGITGRKSWPESNRVLSETKNGVSVQDEFLHEQCLVITENGKNILVSGCAHNGILNIIDRFVSLFGSYPYAVLSGFHMMKKEEYTSSEIRTIRETASELKRMPTLFYTGHCTGEPAFELMKKIMGDSLIKLHSGDSFVLT